MWADLRVGAKTLNKHQFLCGRTTKIQEMIGIGSYFRMKPPAEQSSASTRQWCGARQNILVQIRPKELGRLRNGARRNHHRLAERKRTEINVRKIRFNMLQNGRLPAIGAFSRWVSACVTPGCWDSCPVSLFILYNSVCLQSLTPKQQQRQEKLPSTGRTLEQDQAQTWEEPSCWWVDGQRTTKDTYIMQHAILNMQK